MLDGFEYDERRRRVLRRETLRQLDHRLVDRLAHRNLHAFAPLLPHVDVGVLRGGIAFLGSRMPNWVSSPELRCIEGPRALSHD